MVVKITAFGGFVGSRFADFERRAGSRGGFRDPVSGRFTAVGSTPVGIVTSIDNAYVRWSRNLERSIAQLTANWKPENYPIFRFEKDFIGIDRAVFNILLEDSPGGKGAQIFNWLDAGTRPHVIEAVNAPALRFRGWDYHLTSKPFPETYQAGSTPNSLFWGAPSYLGDRTVLIPRRGNVVYQPGPPGRFLPNSYGNPRAVHHPGVEPRNFSAQLVRLYQPDLEREINSIIRTEHAI